MTNKQRIRLETRRADAELELDRLELVPKKDRDTDHYTECGEYVIEYGWTINRLRQGVANA